VAINWLDDVGAPALVTVVNIAARNSTAAPLGMPVADLATYIMTIGGYLAGNMGWAPRYSGFIKNIGIAAAPLAMEKLYTMIKGTTPAAARVTRPVNRVARYPAPAAESPFQGVRLV